MICQNTIAITSNVLSYQPGPPRLPRPSAPAPAQEQAENAFPVNNQPSYYIFYCRSSSMKQSIKLNFSYATPQAQQPSPQKSLSSLFQLPLRPNLASSLQTHSAANSLDKKHSFSLYEVAEAAPRKNGKGLSLSGSKKCHLAKTLQDQYQLDLPQMGSLVQIGGKGTSGATEKGQRRSELSQMRMKLTGGVLEQQTPTKIKATQTKETVLPAYHSAIDLHQCPATPLKTSALPEQEKQSSSNDNLSVDISANDTKPSRNEEDQVVEKFRNENWQLIEQLRIEKLRRGLLENKLQKIMKDLEHIDLQIFRSDESDKLLAQLREQNQLKQSALNQGASRIASLTQLLQKHTEENNQLRSKSAQLELQLMASQVEAQKLRLQLENSSGVEPFKKEFQQLKQKALFYEQKYQQIEKEMGSMGAFLSDLALRNSQALKNACSEVGVIDEFRLKSQELDQLKQIMSQQSIGRAKGDDYSQKQGKEAREQSLRMKSVKIAMEERQQEMGKELEELKKRNGRLVASEKEWECKLLQKDRQIRILLAEVQQLKGA